MTDQMQIEDKIKDIIEKDIKPALAMDGGSCEFKSYDDGIVSLELQGACKGCPGAAMTLKMGIEARLKKELPEVKEVISV